MRLRSRAALRLPLAAVLYALGLAGGAGSSVDGEALLDRVAFAGGEDKYFGHYDRLDEDLGYHKPGGPNGPMPWDFAGGVSGAACVRAVSKLARWDREHGAEACLSCADLRRGPCPAPCGPRVADLYASCDGVDLLDGLFYDPGWSVKGKWGAEVRHALKAQLERCGCDGAGALAATSAAAALVLALATQALAAAL